VASARRRGVVRVSVRGRRQRVQPCTRWRVAVLPGPVFSAPPVNLVARWSKIAATAAATAAAAGGRVGRRVRPCCAVGHPGVVLDVCQRGAAGGVGDEDAGEEGLGQGGEPRGVLEGGCCNGSRRGGSGGGQVRGTKRKY